MHICLVRIMDRRVSWLTPMHTKATVRFHRKSSVRTSVRQMDVQLWTVATLVTDADSRRVLFHSDLHNRPPSFFYTVFLSPLKTPRHLFHIVILLFQNKYSVL